MKVEENERLDDLLYNGLKIFQRKDRYCFGCDAVELANYVVAKPNEYVIDLGSGTGIIAILLASKKGVKVTCVEIQEEMAQLSRKSIMYNHLEELIDVINTPMQKINAFLPKGCADIVVTNPPYRRAYTGETSTFIYDAISKHEIMVSLPEVLDSTAYLLRDKGKLYIVHQVERLPEVIKECIDRKLEPKELQILTPNNQKRPHIFMLKCVKGGNKGLNILKERPVKIEV